MKRLLMNPVIRYLTMKIAFYMFTFFVATSLVFILYRMMPGDPLRDALWRIRMMYGAEFGEELEMHFQRFTIEFGLDQPLHIQWLCFLRQYFIEHRMGFSLIEFPTPVEKLIADALPWTIGLLVITTIISWITGTLLGTISGWRRGSKSDALLFTLSLIFSMIPYYVIAITLSLTIAYTLYLLPGLGRVSPFVKPMTIEWFISVIRHGTLPALSIMIVGFWGGIMEMRSLVVSILGSDYLLLARAKGLKSRSIITDYVLKNAWLPRLTSLALSMGFIIGGSFLVEFVFAYPGMGWLFFLALRSRDYNLIQGITTLTIFSVLVANMLIDLIIPFLDPRVRYGEKV